MTEVKITEWTLDGVLEEIFNVHTNMKDRHYAFILGAGASKSSGIHTGHELAQRWLEEIYRRECLNKALTIEEWLESGDSGFTDSKISFADAGSHYPQIFERRFYGDREAGYAALEDAIEGKIPSLGYSLLASIIQETRHKVVITTNFDNLVADALSMQAHQSPLIVAHESLAGFVRPNLRRPLVAKIHRDLFLSPKNDHTGVSTMEESWKEALKKIFQHYTPIVIGYGGNDGSLMNMLSDLPEGSISGRIFLCCRDTEVPDKAKSVLIKHKGVLAKIAGFDEFMLQLAEKLVPDFIVEKIPETLEHLGKTRAQDYRKQIEKITKSSSDEKVMKIVLNSANKHDDWWSWQLKINAEKDSNTRQELYEEAILKLPNSPELKSNFAIFLENIRKDNDKAEIHYQKAIELDPDDANYTGNYANFLTDIRKDYDKAETLYKKAIELDPDDADYTGDYATFLTDIRKDYDNAETLYQKAMNLDPKHANNTRNYATFLKDIRKDHDRAETLHQKAIELSPDDADHLSSYAIFLANTRKDYDKAETLYKKVIDLNPNDANNLANYSCLLSTRQTLENTRLINEYTEHIIEITKPEPTQALAEALLYTRLSYEQFPEIIKSNPLPRLKNLINIGFNRGDWSFEYLFDIVLPGLSDEKQNFYRTLGDAILDQQKVNLLENFTEWKNCEEIDVFADFEDSN